MPQKESSTSKSVSQETHLDKQEELDTDNEGIYHDGIKPEYRKLEKEPTQDEIYERSIDHVALRAWYPHCIHGHANAVSHKRIMDRTYDIPHRRHGLRQHERRR